MSAPDEIASLLGRLTEGVRLLTAEEVEVERVSQAQDEIVRRARAFRAQLEPALDAQTFARLAPDSRLHAVAQRYEVTRGSVLILGPAGSGKSLTVRRIGRRLLGAAWRAGDVDAPIVGALWVSALELATALRETRLGSSCDPFRSAQRTPLLFLDELGQEHHDPRWLLDLLDVRYAPKHRATLTTTGLTHAQLVERYGVGAVRRLTEPTGMTLDLFTERSA